MKIKLPRKPAASPGGERRKLMLTFPVAFEKAAKMPAVDFAKRNHMLRWLMIEELLDKEGYELVVDLFEHSIRKKCPANEQKRPS